MDPETAVALQTDSRGGALQPQPPVQRKERQDPLSDPLQGKGLSDPLQKKEGEGEQARGKDGTAEGLKNYEAALGKFLGSQLYGLVAPHLTLDKMAKYADDAFTGALSGGVGLLDKLEGDVDGEAIDKFSKALTEHFAVTASEWVKGDGKEFAGKCAKWVDAHPGTVVTVALLAAAGAVAANLEIPELKQKFGITDQLNAEVAAKVGKLRDISLKSIEAGLTYQGEIVQASYKGTYESEDDKHTHEVKAGFKDDQNTFSFTGTGTFKGDDLEVYSLDGSYKRVLGNLGDGSTTLGLGGGLSGGGDNPTLLSSSISLADGSTLQSLSGKYDVDTGVFTLIGARKYMLDNGSLSLSQSMTSDGGSSQKLDYEGKSSALEGLTTKFSLEESIKALGADSAYELDENHKLSLGLDYSQANLDAALDAVFDTGGESSISSSLGTKFGGGWTAGGNAKVELNDPKLSELGAYFGFRDPDAFRTYLGKYKYLANEDSHSFNLMMEEKLWDVYFRVEQSARLSQAGGAFESKGHAAYFLDDKKDVGLIGGVTARYGSDSDNALIPQVGMQIKGVPLLIGYDVENKGFNIGLTIPFGRRK